MTRSIHARLCLICTAALLAGLLAVNPSCQRSPNPAGGGADGDSSPSSAPIGELDPSMQATELATRLLNACGGQEAWDKTRFITFQYFDGKRHTWDKENDLLRIDMPSPLERPAGGLFNLTAGEARAWEGGTETTNPDRVEMIRASATKMWRNDSFWVLLPFMLFDSNTELKYIGEGKTDDGAQAELLDVVVRGEQLRRRCVLYIDPETNLVAQWDFFNRETDVDPYLVAPWLGWEQFGDLLISTDRGVIQNQVVKFEKVAVFDDLPESVFTEFIPLPDHVRDFNAATGGAPADTNGG